MRSLYDGLVEKTSTHVKDYTEFLAPGATSLLAVQAKRTHEKREVSAKVTVSDPMVGEKIIGEVRQHGVYYTLSDGGRNRAFFWRASHFETGESQLFRSKSAAIWWTKLIG